MSPTETKIEQSVPRGLRLGKAIGGTALLLAILLLVMTPAPTAIGLFNVGELLFPITEPVADTIHVLPSTVLLEVENILQYPELPNGCEATSLTILLRYLGYPTNKMELAEDYIPHQAIYYENGNAYGANPAEGYTGNPWDMSGFYVFAPAVASAANRYLAAQGSSLAARDISGADEVALIRQLQVGNPVVVWNTLDFGPAEYSDFYWTMEGTQETHSAYSNLHCMVLVGFDDEYFSICNPLVDGIQVVEREEFITGYVALGQQAIVVT